MQQAIEDNMRENALPPHMRGVSAEPNDPTARSSHEGMDVSHVRGPGDHRQKVLELLRSASIPQNSRQNTIVAGEAPGRAMCLGLTTDWHRGPAISQQTRRHETLTEAICRWAKQEMPDLKFTSIQVNAGTRARLHVDGYNLGPSAIISMGSFTGGQLWCHDGTRRGSAISTRISP